MQALLVDDHALFREGMKHLLRHLLPDATIYQAASVREATDLLSKHREVDLVLLDLQLPGMRGIQALNAMREFSDDVPIVVLSGAEEPETIRASIEGGAMGFIQKSVNPDEMLEAVETVLAGRLYLPGAVLEQTTNGTSSRIDLLKRLGITGRRADVLVHLARGKPTKSIARDLGISEATVKTHIQDIYEALGVHSRTQAVYVLAGHGWALADIAQ